MLWTSVYIFLLVLCDDTTINTQHWVSNWICLVICFVMMLDSICVLLSGWGQGTDEDVDGNMQVGSYPAGVREAQDWVWKTGSIVHLYNVSLRRLPNHSTIFHPTVDCWQVEVREFSEIPCNFEAVKAPSDAAAAVNVTKAKRKTRGKRRLHGKAKKAFDWGA